jgi:hypothetical protein
MPEVPTTTIYLWVSFELPEAPPQRVRAFVCLRCRAITTELHRHLEWHDEADASAPR